MTIKPAEEHLEVHVVAHTHWDREWYRPEPAFRQRLVALVDGLLERPGAYPFLLDGQAVLLEDYLAVRPERAADLSAALRTGSLEAGPWFVLADELVPSGEGLVRNLLAGRRTLQALRAATPAVLWCPDSFGHPAALPAIAAGFGIGVVVLWRGFGGRHHPHRDAVRWMAPDGSSVLLLHLPPDGYESGSHLPAGEGAAARWARLREVLAPRAATGVVLLPAGADHHAPQPDLPAAIDALARAARPDRVVRSSLAGAAAAIAGAATVPLAEVNGELRDSYGYTWTLQGTLGSRLALKRAYASAERTLLRDVEPWAALVWVRGGADRRHLLRAAWRPLLLCQPHDTLCGCSIDEVAQAMQGRLAEARAASDAVRGASLDDLLGHDADAARALPAAWRPVVVVRNACARPRGGVAELEVDQVLAEAPVGPASAGIAVSPAGRAPLAVGHPAVPLQVIGSRRTFAREEAPAHYPRNRLVERRRVLAWLDPVPAYGLRTLPVSAGRSRARAPVEVSIDGDAILNDAATIRHDRDGLRLQWSGGRVIDDWLVLESEGEQGDLYTSSPVPRSLVRHRPARVRVTARGPLRAELMAEWRLSIPARHLATAAGEVTRLPRQRVAVSAAVQLDAGAGFVRLHLTGDNDATDLRLRLAVGTGLPGARVRADAAFGTVGRRPVEAPDSTAERPPATAPLHRFVTLHGAGSGATLFSDGLTEYEVRPDGTLLVTLFRAVGELSRHDLVERPGHAGYPVATPRAQEPGPFEARLAFALHGASDAATDAAVEAMADDALMPLTGETWRTAIDPPPAVAGVALEGAGLAFSAATISEDGGWMVLRCVNVLDREAGGAWRCAAISSAMLARLDETPLQPLAVHDGEVRFAAPARAVVTVLVR